MTTLNHLFWICLLLSSTSCLVSNAEAKQAGTDSGDHSGLIVEMHYLWDGDHSLTIQDLLTTEIQNQFVANEQKHHLLSKSNSYWVRIKARRKIDSGNDYFLQVGYPTLDRVICYGVEGSEVFSVEQSGDGLPFSERTHPFRNHLFLLQFPDTDFRTYYLNIRSTGNMTVPVHFFEAGSYPVRDNLSTLEVGVGLGLMLIVGLYALILGISIGERSYIFFGLYIFSVATFIATRNGIGSVYFWPEAPSWNDKVLHISFFLFLSFSSLFSNYFLDVKSHTRILSGILVLEASVFLSMATLIGFGINQDIFPRLGIVGIVHSITMLFVGVTAWLKGKSGARIYTVGMLLYIVMGMVHLLALYDYLPDVFTQLIVMRLGWYFEVVFLTIAVGRNYRRTIRENERLNSLKINSDLALQAARQSFERSRMEISQKDRKLMIANMERQQHIDTLEELRTKAEDHRLKHKINRLITINELGNSQWDSFRTVFSEIHPHFFEKLQLAHPKLTTNDLRHLAYIKLNLNLKEIADIAGVSVQAVKMARNRLKKKIRIADSLADYVRKV